MLRLPLQRYSACAPIIFLCPPIAFLTLSPILFEIIPTLCLWYPSLSFNFQSSELLTTLSTMRLQRGQSQQFVTFSVFIASLVNLSEAFFPTPWKEVVFGAGGVSHMEQTEQAFQSLATQYFPKIDHLSKSMINARDTISQANADVDKDQDHSALHCDGENFDGAQSRLQSLHTDVITNLNNNDVDAARKSLGSALHTVQDFYAHSNYVEMGNSAPSDLLGRAGTIPHAAFTDQTCKGCITTINPLVCNDCSANEAGFLGLLTSGYYFGEDSPPAGTDIPAIKCHHGKQCTNTSFFRSVLSRS